jgi:hypothetical protein
VEDKEMLENKRKTDEEMLKNKESQRVREEQMAEIKGKPENKTGQQESTQLRKTYPGKLKENPTRGCLSTSRSRMRPYMI